jgi:FAD dependent oxidoreductase
MTEVARSAEVVVYGPTAAGVMAAVAAGELGAEVTLVGPESHVGGMVASGLSWTDIGREEAVSGLARHFYELVATHYQVPAFSLRGPEPHVAESIFEHMLDAAGVRLCLGAAFAGVEVRDSRVVALRAGGERLEAGVVIDASYEGDLMAAAGVPFRVGREPRSLHGEKWAGRQPAYRPGAHNFAALVSPFRTEGSDELLPELYPPARDERGWPVEGLGDGDGGLQAYQLRLCMTDRLANQVPLGEPAGYDPSRFEVLRRYLALVGDGVPAGRLMGLVPDLLPNAKCDVNSIGPFSLNVLDGTNRAYVGSDATGRAAIYHHHRRYSHELLYFLSHDEAVPTSLRRQFGRWSLCADEFTGSGGWPHQLYVREARRMVGTVVLTEHDLLSPVAVPDPVATGSYNIDIREVERTWRYLPEYRAQPAVFNEGYLSIAVPPYPVPFRCLLPRPEDADNLIVPVCCSASQVAYGSLRTEPTLMALGEAAGVGAALAARSRTVPARLPAALLVDAVRSSAARRATQ